MRKGGVDIPAMILLNSLAGVYGIVWATPVADVVSMIVAVICFIPFWKGLHQKMREQDINENVTSPL